MKYIKRGYIMDTEYMKVESEDKLFYRGVSIMLDKSENKVHRIELFRIMDYKSVNYCITEITKEEFDTKFDFAIEFSRNKK